MKKRVLLASRRYANSFVNLPYLMAKEGMFVDLVAIHGNLIGKSKWVTESFISDDNDTDFSRLVFERLLKNSYDYLVIVDEPALLAIYQNPMHIAFSKYLPLLPESLLAASIGNKHDFYEWCINNDIEIPSTKLVSSWQSTCLAADEIGFPCVLKKVSGLGGQGVYIVNNAEELSGCEPYFQSESAWLIQTYIQGRTCAISFFSFQGELRAWIGLTKSICLLNGKGPSVIRDFVNNDELEKLARKFSTAGAINGMTGVDVMINDQGRAYVIDPHLGRCCTSHHFGLLCDVDFGRSLHEALQGASTFYRPVPCDVVGVKFPEYLQFIREQGLIRLLREAPPFSRHVKYFSTPPGDWQLFLMMLKTEFFSALRISLGAWKNALKLRWQYREY